MSLVKPSLGYIRFVSDDSKYFFTCLLGDGTPQSTGGYAGWATISRARRRALTEWQGNDPLTIDIPILFDHFASGTSAEFEIAMLEAMGGLVAGMTEPPLVQFDSGGVVPHDIHGDSTTFWVISGLQWGDADRNRNGNRVRQAVTVTVMQYVEHDSLSALSSAQRRKLAAKKRSVKKGSSKKGAEVKRYVVKAGETLEHIAAHALGKSTRWHELKKLNPSIRDPKKVLKAGTIIKMP